MIFSIFENDKFLEIINRLTAQVTLQNLYNFIIQIHRYFFLEISYSPYGRFKFSKEISHLEDIFSILETSRIRHVQIYARFIHEWIWLIHISFSIWRINPLWPDADFMCIWDIIIFARLKISKIGIFWSKFELWAGCTLGLIFMS